MSGIFAQGCGPGLNCGSANHSRRRQGQLIFSCSAIVLLLLAGLVWRHEHIAAKLSGMNGSQGNAPAASTPSSRPHLATAYGKLPLSFEVNAGQSDARVKFLARGLGYSLFLTKSQAVLALKASHASKDSFPKASIPGQALASSMVATLQMSLLGANQDAQISGLQELPGKSNYFFGNNPSAWRQDVPNYRRVKYTSVYPGVDLIYYGRDRQLEYDFVVSPGADPRVIALQVSADGFADPEAAGGRATLLHINANGDLVLRGASGEIRFRKPVVYQEYASTSGRLIRKARSGNYVLSAKNRVAFDIPDYDKAQPLVIDPILTYSGYLGSFGFDTATSIAVDAAGNAYIAGSTTSPQFPTSAGAAQPVLHDGPQCASAPCGDAFVAKLDATGANLIYSTYLGGSGTDIARDLAVDASGNAYVTGSTSSIDFPMANPLQPTYGGGPADSFVTKVNPSGNALVYSTYLGGNDLDQGTGIALDPSGNAYVVGGTQSVNFAPPSAVGTCQGGGVLDGFIFKLNPAGSALAYSTCFGGSHSDQALGVAVNSGGSAYIVGSTSSSNFPTSSRGYQRTLLGSQNAFLLLLNTAGNSIVYSTLFGGNGGDAATGVALDAKNFAYITGNTTSANFPVTSGAYQTTSGGSQDAFIAKFNLSGSGPSSLVYSSYVGGSGNDAAVGIAVDTGLNAYVTGYTSSSNFPVVNPVQVALAGGSTDAFVFELNPQGTGAVYSTYLGGSGSEGSNGFGGIAIDALGNAYVAGSTTSTDFPTVTAFQASNAGGIDAFVAKIGALSTPLPGLILQWPLPTLQDRSIFTENYSEFNLVGNHMYHTGLSFAAPMGTTVGAAAAGDVVMIQLNPPAGSICYDHGYGNTVFVQHTLSNGQNVYTQYSHLLTIDPTIQQQCGTANSQSQITCSVPVPVSALQTLGTVGHTACGYSSSGSVHLHLELKNFLALVAPQGPGISGYVNTPPDEYGLFNPVENLNPVTNLSVALPVVVTGTSPVNILTGPGGAGSKAYRTINQVSPGVTLDARRLVTGGTSTPPCSAGWYEVGNLNGSLFADTFDTGTGQMLYGWICADNVSPAGSGNPPSPVLHLSTNTLTFNATQGGSNPSSQSVNVTNTGVGTLNFSASSDSSWLAVTPTGGTAPQSLQISSTVGTLATGTYTGHITVTSAGALGSPSVITVTFVVAAPPQPVLSVSTANLTFNATQGGANPSSQSVNVTNSGTGTLSFTAGSDSSWLTVTPGNGTAPQSLQISSAVGSLLAGTYTGHITVTSTGAQGSPATVTVTFVVAAPPRPVLSVSTANLTFNATQGGTNPSSQSVSITNSGTGTLTFTAGSDSSWLAVTPTGGTAPQSIQISSTVGALVAGTYTGHVTVTSTGAQGSPAIVTVTFTIASPPPPQPILSVLPSTLTFNATQGGANPTSQAVNVTNTGTGTLNFTAGSDSSWLTVTPTSGTAPQPLQISAIVGTLAAGTYTGHITVTSAGAQGSPSSITVTFTVATPATPAAGGFFVRGGSRANTSAAATIAQGWSGQPQQADLLALYVWWNSSTVAVSSVADNCGNTWLSTPAQIDSVDNAQAQLFYVAGSKSCQSSPYVTVTFGSAVLSRMVMGDWSGVGVGATYYDAGASNFQASTASPATSLTTANSSDLLVQVAAGNNSSDTFTSGGGFNTRQMNKGMVMADQTVSSAQTYATNLAANSADNILSGMFAFQLTTAGSYPLQSSNSSATATSISCAYPQPAKAGDLLAALVRWPTDGTVSISVSDNVNGAWLPAGSQAFETFGPHSSQLFYLPNSVAGTITVTATPSNGTSQALFIECTDLTGMATANPLDGAPATAASAKSVTNLSVGPLTTTNNNDVLLLACATNAGTRFTSDAGFTNTQQLNLAVLEDKLVGSPATYTQVCSGGAAYYTGTLAAFKQAH